MLRRIFNRNRKGPKKSKSKKQKKSKYNKLNISTEETNINSRSFIESGPDADDEDEIDLPKLNFTCILNNPLEDTNHDSLFGQLLMRFQENQKIVTEEERMKKEGYKFDLIDIIQDDNKGLNNSMLLENKILKKLKQNEEEEEEELDDILNDLEQLENIFGSKKTLEQCIKETNEELFKNKKTFKLKKFVDLSYNNYIAKIKHEYLIYKENQKKNIIKKIKYEDVLNQEIKLGTKDQILNQINNYRKSLNSSMDLIEKDYKVDIKDFKIRDDLLNNEIDKISENIIKLIEQKGIIELEAEKSNINYDIIKLFFRNNYPLIVNQVDNMQFKIANLVNKKNSLKTKFIDSTQRMILLKLKRQNMIKLTEIYKMMLEAKCDKIESISNVKDIREIKQKIKKVSNMGINIIKKVNEELNTKEVNISSDNINKVITLIKNEINNCFDIETYMNEEEEEEDEEDVNSIKNKYNYQYYNMEENIFKKIIHYKNNIKENSKTKDYIILIIKSLDEDFIKNKIYSYLDMAENKEEYMNKIYDTLLTSMEQVILTTLGKILPLKNMNEILYLFIISSFISLLFVKNKINFDVIS